MSQAEDMKSPADPSTRVAVDATIDAQINHSEPTFDSIIPELPIEILASILEFLKLDGHFKALTMVARANQTMYDLAIPKIYEVVGINERNVKVIGYGHGSQSLDRNEGMSQARRELLSDDEASLPVKPTRKDLATGHTRKLIIDVEPESAVPTSYTRVNEVELGPRSFCHPGIHPLGHWDYPFIKESVENVAPRDTSTPPLHVRVCIGQHTDIDSLEILLNALETPAPFSCEFLDVYIDQNEFTLFVAFLRGAVVRYRDTDLDKEEIIGEIAGQLNICIITEDFAEGRYVYLCDIPELVLSPYELRTADDIYTAAKTKLFDQIEDWPEPLEESISARWAFFNSRVKLVETGFRPTMADLVAFPKPTWVPSCPAVDQADPRLYESSTSGSDGDDSDSDE